MHHWYGIERIDTPVTERDWTWEWGGRAGGLNLDKGHEFSCARRRPQGDRLTLRARLEEGCRFAAPHGAWYRAACWRCRATP